MQDFGQDLYKESKKWGIGIWLFLIFLYLSFVIALLVSINTGATLAVSIPLLLIIIWNWFRTSLKIRVTKGWLIVGKAKIERAYIKEIIAYSPKEFVAQSRAELNVMAYFQTRPWLKSGVKIVLRDPKDPTPYWLIASCNPKKLKEILNQGE